MNLTAEGMSNYTELVARVEAAESGLSPMNGDDVRAQAIEAEAAVSNDLRMAQGIVGDVRTFIDGSSWSQRELIVLRGVLSYLTQRLQESLASFRRTQEVSGRCDLDRPDISGTGE